MARSLSIGTSAIRAQDGLAKLCEKHRHHYGGSSEGPQGPQIIGAPTIYAQGGCYSLSNPCATINGNTKYQPAESAALESTKALIAKAKSSPNPEGSAVITERNGDTYICRKSAITHPAWISQFPRLKVVRAFLSRQTQSAPILSRIASSLRQATRQTHTTHAHQDV